MKCNRCFVNKGFTDSQGLCQDCSDEQQNLKNEYLQKRLYRIEKAIITLAEYTERQETIDYIKNILNI